ncbi:hypothetical protein ASC97_30695 [Rhizobium sp. Root1203]|nr:hypothetical protein ASC97_30695 [Rhizobium sp. Root1203]
MMVERRATGSMLTTISQSADRPASEVRCSRRQLPAEPAYRAYRKTRPDGLAGRDRLHAKNIENQTTETHIAASALNRISAFGRANYERVS